MAARSRRVPAQPNMFKMPPAVLRGAEKPSTGRMQSARALRRDDGANGIGGTVTCSPLPHHQDVRVRIRRFRGLRIATEEARETKRIEVSDGKGVRQGRTVRQTARAVWAARRFCGESPIDPQVA